MKTELIDWKRPSILYILVVNSFIKFGITSNWEKRKKAYNKELGLNHFSVIKKIEFEFRWQAELIEQIVKWRLRRWVVNGRHEWVQLPIQPVLDCINQTIKEIEPEYHRHKYIHKKGVDRWDFYKQIAHKYFDDK
jgi:hypothetical protein